MANIMLFGDIIAVETFRFIYFFCFIILLPSRQLLFSYPDVKLSLHFSICITL